MKIILTTFLIATMTVLMGPAGIAEAATTANAKTTNAAKTAKAKTSAEKQAMISKSIASYKGNCPCPWNTMKNGRSCGKTSAWSKPGGAQPLCYEWEIK